jgi:hypothetical protein
MQDRLTEIALDFADAGEQALFCRNPMLCASAVNDGHILYGYLDPGKACMEIQGHSKMI